MRSMFIVMMVFLVLGVGMAAAQSADESAVNSGLDEFYAALNRGDVESYLTRYHEDAVYAVEKMSLSAERRSQRLRVHHLRMGCRLNTPTRQPVFCPQRPPSRMAAK